MQKILFVAGDLEYTHPAAQLVHLALALPAEFERRVFVVGWAGPWAERLRAAGVAVDVPGRGRLLDLKPLTELRRLVRDFAPSVLHAWTLKALRPAALCGHRGRVVASPFVRPARRWLPGRWLDAWILRRADRVVAFGDADAARCRALGVAEGRVVTVRPAVRPEPAAPVRGLPEGVPYLACVGRLETIKGFREAVMSLDMLRYIHPDLHLVLAGDGPQRPAIEQAARGVLRPASAAVLLGRVADVFGVLDRAEAVWVPGRSETGVQVALEGMAAGRPVVAARWPRLAEVVRDEETGLLATPGDLVSWARQTQRLLGDPGLAGRLAEAGRRFALEQCRPDDLARRCAEVYRNVG